MTGEKSSETTMTVRHGLYYVDRFVHNASIYTLDTGYMPQVPRPERDVLAALLRYALDQLQQQDALEKNGGQS